MIGLFGQPVKDEKSREKRDLPHEILSILHDNFYGISEYDLAKKLGIKTDKLGPILAVMLHQEKVFFDKRINKWKKIWGNRG